jgi:hypothetical protein
MAELFDIVIRRQVYIEGLKAGKSNEYAAVIAALTRELRARLAHVEFASLGDMTKTAIRALVIDLKNIARRIFSPYLTSLIEWLKQFMAADREILTTLYPSFVANAAVPDVPDDRKLFAAAWAAPMAATGTLAAPFLAALLPTLLVRLERATIAAYASRGKTADLSRSIVGTAAARYRDGALAGVYRAGNAATNTVIQHLAAQSNDAIIATLFSWYEWISILDNHTTPICISRSGNVYETGKGPVPPAHVGCRSTTAPMRTPDDATAPKLFSLWVKTQSTDFLNDAFDGSAPSRYEGSHAISLAEYAGKRTLIGA